jgi:NitT/TauT family transport system substrate-binding protein/sulfonate transport system substrate-binding protein
MTRSRRWLSLALVVLAAGLVLSACGSSDAGGGDATAAGKDGYTVRYGFVTNSGDLDGPNGLAYRKGELQKDLAKGGVTDVKLIPFPNGPNVAAALVHGDIDVGDFGDTPALIAGGQGVPAKLLQFTGTKNQAWLIARKDGPTSVDDLAGQKVATAPGSYMDRYLGGLLAEKGLNDKVQVGNLLPPAGIQAIQNGSLDAYAFPFPLGALLAGQGYPVLDKASDHPGLTGNSVTLISDEARSAHPDLVATWRAATQAANRAVQADPDAYWAFQAKTNKVPVAAAEESYPVANYPTEPYPAEAFRGLQGTLDYLVDTKQAKAFDLNAWKVGRP